MTDTERLELILEECGIAYQNVIERAEYSFTPARARDFRIGAAALIKEIKFRLDHPIILDSIFGDKE